MGETRLALILEMGFAFYFFFIFYYFIIFKFFKFFDFWIFLFFWIFLARSLFPFLVTREAVAPLANDPIMSEISICSFRHLERQNPSIISDSIGRARMVQQIPRSRNGTECRSTVGLEDLIINNIFPPVYSTYIHCPG